jgi:DNA-binding transcriptional LysR family regulator
MEVEIIEMSRIEDISAFIAVVESGSLTEAGRRVGRSLQAISRSLAVLEDDVGVKLVHRTTRRCTPSEAGLAFYERVSPAIADILEAKLEAVSRSAEPSGILRIGAPVLFGPDLLMPIIAEYMLLYPRVEIDLDLTDAFADLVASKLDLTVRIAHLPDSGLQGRRLGELRRVVFGAPSYFDRRGRPKHPLDLREHACIVRTIDPRPGDWAFQIDGKSRVVRVNGPFRTNTMTAVYSAVGQGLGIGYSPLWQIRSLVASGAVEIVLEEFEPVRVPIHALWQENKLAPAKVRRFVDLMARELNLHNL